MWHVQQMPCIQYKDKSCTSMCWSKVLQDEKLHHRKQMQQKRWIYSWSKMWCNKKRFTVWLTENPSLHQSIRCGSVTFEFMMQWQTTGDINIRHGNRASWGFQELSSCFLKHSDNFLPLQVSNQFCTMAAVGVTTDINSIPLSHIL